MGKHKRSHKKKLNKPKIRDDGSSTPRASPFLHPIIHHVEGTSSVVASPAAALDTQESEDDICLSVARTALVLPFKYRSSITASTRWAEQIQSRKISLMGKDTIPLWLPAENLPKEVGDLSPVFRSIFGASTSSRPKTWACTRLILNDIVLKEIFPSPKLHTVQKGEQYPYPVMFDAIELILYPLGCALLVIHINWLPPSSTGEIPDLTLHELSSLMFVAKYKHMITDVCLGWGFSVDNENPMVSQVVQDSLGILFDARYRNKTVSLGTLGNWLLQLPGEDPSDPPLRLDYSRHAQHHTCVVTQREPAKETIQHYLFILRHAYGQKNRPPIDNAETLGRVLVWRANRYVGVSKEGSVSMSWSVSNMDHDFEITNWYRKFQGVFLLLNLHAVAEKRMLTE